VPDFGIDASYLASDRKRWLLRCGRCKHWADLPNEFPDCLVQHRDGSWRQVCVRCGARLYRDRGEWVAECPGAEVSGYQASQLYGPFVTDAEIAARWATARRTPSVLKNFTISILGKPFAGDDQPLNEGVLATACEPDRGLGPVPGAIATYAGIDQGDISYIVVGARCPDGKVRICHVEQTTDWSRLARILLDFNCLFSVVDAQPGKSEAKRLMRTEGVAGAIAYFSGQGLQTGFEDLNTASPMITVKADRTEAIDDMAGHFGPCREWLLPAARLEVVQTVKQHCYKLVKVRDRLGKDVYAKGVTNHYGLSLTYLDLAIRAADALGIGPATPLGAAEDWYTEQPPGRVF
jgi:hypothetical protein